LHIFLKAEKVAQEGCIPNKKPPLLKNRESNFYGKTKGKKSFSQFWIRGNVFLMIEEKRPKKRFASGLLLP